MKLILATNNKHKVVELTELLSDLDMVLGSLADYPSVSEIVEDGATFLANAQKKARAVAKALGEWTLADDSGLVVRVLGGEPGVYSARYAGKQGDYAANNLKLIEKMKGVSEENRGAAFVCSMVLISPDGREWDVEGRSEGIITRKPRGDGGFGYDPLFFIPKYGKTMAELSIAQKNEISHRGNALRKIREILVAILGQDK